MSDYLAVLRSRATEGTEDQALPDELLASRSFLLSQKDIANIVLAVQEKLNEGKTDWQAAKEKLDSLAAKNLAVWEAPLEEAEDGSPFHRFRAALFSGYLDKFVADYGKKTVAMDTTFNTNGFGTSYWGSWRSTTLASARGDPDRQRR